MSSEVQQTPLEELAKNYVEQLMARCWQKSLTAKAADSKASTDTSKSAVFDFTHVFKKPRGKPRKKHEPAVKDDKENAVSAGQPVDLVSVHVVYEIPRNLTITQALMRERKCLDIRRWFCMARPQYSKSCGITSLVSCWNYLYSTLGTGSLPPISQEEAMELLGFQPPFGEIKFGPFTGNQTLIQWFGLLNKHYKVAGQGSYFWKMHGGKKTVGIDSETALRTLEDELQKENSAFIYHCYNHYCCPLGYEVTPIQQPNAYKTKAEIQGCETDHWIIIGEPSKCYPVFHIKKWTEIAMDISNQYPNYYNMRKPQKGIMQFTAEVFVTGKSLGKNCHCLLKFEKLPSPPSH